MRMSYVLGAVIVLLPSMIDAYEVYDEVAFIEERHVPSGSCATSQQADRVGDQVVNALDAAGLTLANGQQCQFHAINVASNQNSARATCNEAGADTPKRVLVTISRSDSDASRLAVSLNGEAARSFSMCPVATNIR